MRVTPLDHPMARHLLGQMRDAATGHQALRGLATRLATLLAIEATRDLPTQADSTTGWAGTVAVERVAEASVMLVPVLRAGLGLLDGVLAVLPGARVGVIGARRNEATLQAEVYCERIGEGLEGSTALLLDPMLATGGTAIAAVARLRAAGCTRIKGLFLVAAPEGLDALGEAHPGIDVHVAAVDERLNEVGYILPGLGDAGDRLFGVTG